MDANTIKKRGFDVETAGCAMALTLAGQSPSLLVMTRHDGWNSQYQHVLGLNIMESINRLLLTPDSYDVYICASFPLFDLDQYCTITHPAPFTATTEVT